MSNGYFPEKLADSNHDWIGKPFFYRRCTISKTMSGFIAEKDLSISDLIFEFTNRFFPVEGDSFVFASGTGNFSAAVAKAADTTSAISAGDENPFPEYGVGFHFSSSAAASAPSAPETGGAVGFSAAVAGTAFFNQRLSDFRIFVFCLKVLVVSCEDIQKIDPVQGVFQRTVIVRDLAVFQLASVADISGIEIQIFQQAVQNGILFFFFRFFLADASLFIVMLLEKCSDLFPAGVGKEGKWFRIQFFLKVFQLADIFGVFPAFDIQKNGFFDDLQSLCPDFRNKLRILFKQGKDFFVE